MHTAVATPSQTHSLKGVRLWAWATLALFVVVVLQGAVVRATSSGAGCGAHWPLCNGEVLPHFQRLATVIEFMHRSLTGISGTMFFVLTAWTFLATPKQHPARKAAVWSLVFLILEALLGAVLVLGHYVENNTSNMRVFVQSIHFTNTMILLAATTAVAVLLGNVKAAAYNKPLRQASLLTIAAVLITGAAGSVAALADTIFPSHSLQAAIAADFAADSPLLIRMRWMHPAASLLIVAATLLLAKRLKQNNAGPAANLLFANLALQMLIGVADVLMLAPTWIQVLHLLGADLFWISLIGISVPLFLAEPSTT
ncbi:heme A synthase [Terriglobus sp. RCC_193]|uniref:COX15/CtaA family protein n=1 Tax=Terriglobus sp. RCC_193 TaxID=3239218 RepID=UPI003524B307